VFSVQERNSFLQRSVDEYKHQLEEQQDLMTAMKNEYDQRLEGERDSGHSRIQILQERVLQTDSEKVQAVKEADDLRDSLTTAQSELTTLREQIQNVQAEISALDDQVKDLTTQNHGLQAENDVLLKRGNTIGARYDANDLVSH
jgi:chromosome segregation ATPase